MPSEPTPAPTPSEHPPDPPPLRVIHAPKRRGVARVVRALVLAVAIVVGIVGFALLATQTPWFREWLRGYIVRQAGTYLDGELAIAHLSGNLFSGIRLSGLVLRQAGRPVIAVEDVSVAYDVRDFVSRGIILHEVVLVRPVVALVHDPAGWNIGRLVKKRRTEADRQGPGRPFTVEALRLRSGTVTIDPGPDAGDSRLPREIVDLDGLVRFDYQPVRYVVTVEGLSFHARRPELLVKALDGTVRVHDRRLSVESVRLRTTGSRLDLNGSIEDYQRRQGIVLALQASPVTLVEFAGFAPVLGRYDLAPRVELHARGAGDALDLQFKVAERAGTADGRLVANLLSERRGVSGTVLLDRVNAKAIVPAWPTTAVNGRVTLDLGFGAGRPTGRASFDVHDLVVGDYRAARVQADTQLSDANVRFVGEASAYGGVATAQGTYALGAAPAGYHVTGTVRDLDLSRLPRALRVPSFESDLAGEYDVAGRGASLHAGVVLEDSRLEGASIGAGARGDATIDRGLQRFGFDGRVDGIDLQRVGSVLRIPTLAQSRYSSDLHGHLTVEGRGARLADLDLTATGHIDGSRLFDGRIDGADFEARLAGQRLDAKVRGDVSDLDPSRVTGNPRHAGLVNGHVDVEAGFPVGAAFTPASLALGGTVALTGTRVGDLTFDRVDAQGAYSASKLTLARLDAEGKAVVVRAEGGVALGTDGLSDLRYHAELRDLPALGALAGQPLKGAATLDGHVEGNGARLTTAGTLEAQGLGYGDGFDALATKGTYSATVPDLDASRANGSADLTSTLATVAGQEIRQLHVQGDYADDVATVTTRLEQEARTVDVNARVVLLPDRRELHIDRLSLAAGSVTWQTPDGTDALVTVRPDAVDVSQLALVNGAQRLSVDGRVATGGNASSDLVARFDAVSVGDLAQALLVRRALRGTLGGEVRITGSPATREVEGTVHVADGAVDRFAYQALDATVGLEGDVVHLDTRLTQKPGATITARGSVPRALFQSGLTGPGADQPVDLTIESTPFDLGVAQALTSEIDTVTGTVSANVTVSGTAATPQMQGTVEVSNGGFHVADSSATYSGLDTTIRFEGTSATIEGLRILDDDRQPMNVTGTIAFEGRSLGAFDVRVDSEQFEIIDGPLGDVEVDTALHVQGRLAEPRIEGDVSVHAGRLELDRLLLAVTGGAYSTTAARPARIEPQTSSPVPVVREGAVPPVVAGGASTVAAAGETPAVQAEEEPSGFYKSLALDVKVRLPDNFILRGNDIRPAQAKFSLGNMNVTVGGDFEVRKATGEDLVVRGTIETVRGTYDFQGRRFTVERDGRIAFRGERPIDPALAVSATREISGILAKVNITGTARAPQVSLESNPPLDQGDILSLIVFNQPINQLGEGQRTSLASRAGSLASGFVVSPIAQSLERSLDLDLFEVQTVSEGGGGPSVTLGEQFGEQLFVKLRQQFGAQEVTEFLLEYRLADFLRLQGAFAEGQGRANRSLTRRVERAGIDLVFLVHY